MIAIKFLKECQEDINDFIESFDECSCDEELHNAKITMIKINEAIAELEALEIKDTQSMTREEARKLIDKHSKKDEFGVGVVSKKVAYIIADYLPKDKQ